MLTVKRRPNGAPAFVNVFEDFFTQAFPEKFINQTGAFTPAVNVTEHDKAITLEFAVPGFEKTDFDINIEKEFITISGKKEVKETATEKNYTRKEFSFNSFKRMFTLPETVDTQAIEATYEKGILHVVLPKKEVKTAEAVKKIEIK